MAEEPEVIEIFSSDDELQIDKPDTTTKWVSTTARKSIYGNNVAQVKSFTNTQTRSTYLPQNNKKYVEPYKKVDIRSQHLIGDSSKAFPSSSKFASSSSKHNIVQVPKATIFPSKKSFNAFNNKNTYPSSSSSLIMPSNVTHGSNKSKESHLCTERNLHKDIEKSLFNNSELSITKVMPLPNVEVKNPHTNVKSISFKQSKSHIDMPSKLATNINLEVSIVKKSQLNCEILPKESNSLLKDKHSIIQTKRPLEQAMTYKTAKKVCSNQKKNEAFTKVSSNLIDFSAKAVTSKSKSSSSLNKKSKFCNKLKYNKESKNNETKNNQDQVNQERINKKENVKAEGENAYLLTKNVPDSPERKVQNSLKEITSPKLSLKRKTNDSQTSNSKKVASTFNIPTEIADKGPPFNENLQLQQECSEASNTLQFKELLKSCKRFLQNTSKEEYRKICKNMFKSLKGADDIYINSNDFSTFMKAIQFKFQTDNKNVFIHLQSLRLDLKAHAKVIDKERSRKVKLEAYFPESSQEQKETALNKSNEFTNFNTSCTETSENTDYSRKEDAKNLNDLNETHENNDFLPSIQNIAYQEILDAETAHILNYNKDVNVDDVICNLNSSNLDNIAEPVSSVQTHNEIPEKLIVFPNAVSKYNEQSDKDDTSTKANNSNEFNTVSDIEKSICVTNAKSESIKQDAEFINNNNNESACLNIVNSSFVLDSVNEEDKHVTKSISLKDTFLKNMSLKSTKKEGKNESFNFPSTSHQNCHNISLDIASTSVSVQPENKQKIESCNNKSDVCEKQIKRLEQHLHKLSKKMKKLHEKEMSLDDMDDDNSYYIMEDRYMKNFMKNLKLLSKLKKSPARIKRHIDKRFHYEGTKYEEINEGVVNLINKKKAWEKHPNFSDILNLIQTKNKDNSMGLDDASEVKLAKEVFEDISKELKRRRIKDTDVNIHDYIPENTVFDDPASHDLDLNEALLKNFAVKEKALDEIIDKYALEKETTNNEDDVDEQNISSTDEDEGKEDENNDLPDTELATSSNDEDTMQNALSKPSGEEAFDVASCDSNSTEPGPNADTAFLSSQAIFVDDDIVVEDENETFKTVNNNDCVDLTDPSSPNSIFP